MSRIIRTLPLALLKAVFSLLKSLASVATGFSVPGEPPDFFGGGHHGAPCAKAEAAAAKAKTIVSAINFLMGVTYSFFVTLNPAPVRMS